jgi:hypothetical protein
MIFPELPTTTAPTGISPLSKALVASARASFMYVVNIIFFHILRRGLTI